MTDVKLGWDEYFLNLAANVALKSKDQSSKIGAIIVGPNREIRSTGFNGFPRGMNDDVPEKQERPLKYKFFEHAERNAIYNAARFGAPIEGCTMYCPWPPCLDCARAIIQAGIKKLVVTNPISACPDRWWDDMKIAVRMLAECDVEYREVGNECVTVSQQRGQQIAGAPKNHIQEDKAQMSLLPLDLLREFLEPAYREGLKKYHRESWRGGFKTSVMMDALQRHLTAYFYDGEDYDQDAETFGVKKHHLGGALFCLLCMCDTVINHPDMDDRRKNKT